MSVRLSLLMPLTSVLSDVICVCAPDAVLAAAARPLRTDESADVSESPTFAASAMLSVVSCLTVVDSSDSDDCVLLTAATLLLSAFTSACNVDASGLPPDAGSVMVLVLRARKVDCSPLTTACVVDSEEEVEESVVAIALNVWMPL